MQHSKHFECYVIIIYDIQRIKTVISKQMFSPYYKKFTERISKMQLMQRQLFEKGFSESVKQTKRKHKTLNIEQNNMS